MSASWDPDSAPWGSQPNSIMCLNRLRKEYREIDANPVDNIFVYPDPAVLTISDALIIGPRDTAYEGGFFVFRVRCPPNYPINPPAVKLRTTDMGRVRFNPNLYKEGKVCLSILGTWSGPNWSPAMNMRAVLLSIQSLMCEEPVGNEPGHEGAGKLKNAAYNKIIAHETIRVAVIGQLKQTSEQLLPAAFRPHVTKFFLSNFDKYIKQCEKYKDVDGTNFTDFQGSNSGTFNFKSLISELKTLQKKMVSGDSQ